MSGVGITGLIEPLNAGSFPVFEDINGLGGFRAVADVTARDAILANFRKVGMVVAIAAGTSYQLVGGITNANWVAYAASAVSSVFGRTGAIVAAANDYTPAQLSGAGYAANQYIAWNGSAFAPATPLTSPVNPGDNGKVPIVNAGDFTYGLIANAQISATAAIATSKLAVGTAGQALITTGGVASWGNDFGATELITTGSFRANATTGFFQIGTNTAGATRAATTGNFRLAYGSTFVSRNQPDNADKAIFEYGVSGGDVLDVGRQALTMNLGSNTTAAFIKSSGAVELDVTGGTASYKLSAAVCLWAPNAPLRGNVTFKIDMLDNAAANATAGRVSINGVAATGGGTAFGGPIQLFPGTNVGVSTTGAAIQNGNLEFFGSSGSAKDNALAGGIYQKDRQAVPTAGPTTSGFFHWSDTGGLPMWMTAANNTLRFDVLTSATATGGAAAIPALAVEYMTITFLGNTRKIPLFAA